MIGKPLMLSALNMLQVNLLVSTSVAEEGLDITDCQLVLRFDLPKTEAAYIQSRGRARKENSTYVMFVERNNAEMMEQVSQLTSVIWLRYNGSYGYIDDIFIINLPLLARIVHLLIFFSVALSAFIPSHQCRISMIYYPGLLFSDPPPSEC